MRRKIPNIKINYSNIADKENSLYLSCYDSIDKCVIMFVSNNEIKRAGKFVKIWLRDTYYTNSIEGNMRVNKYA